MESDQEYLFACHACVGIAFTQPYHETRKGHLAATLLGARYRDDADLERHVDYIHFNSVKHGLVSRVSDWPHSSFHRYVTRGILPSDWGGDMREISGKLGE
jgi:REP element-mobilizing transposase RayT